MLFAVNGTLMRGLPLNGNLKGAGALFVREARTALFYRLYSVDDRYPGMVRATDGGGEISLELWQIDAEGLVKVLSQEPPGLTVGKIVLSDNSEVLGVLAEPYLVENSREITSHGGWRNYVRQIDGSRDP